jgi:hypothetical protein
MEAGTIVFPKNQIAETRRYSDVILQIRKRLFITGDLKIDSQKKIFDNDYWKVLKYKNATDSLRFLTVYQTY